VWVAGIQESAFGIGHGQHTDSTARQILRLQECVDPFRHHGIRIREDGRGTVHFPGNTLLGGDCWFFHRRLRFLDRGLRFLDRGLRFLDRGLRFLGKSFWFLGKSFWFLGRWGGIFCRLIYEGGKPGGIWILQASALRLRVLPSHQ
jgi:hypothetical protein